MSSLGLRTSSTLLLREEPRYFDCFVVFDYALSVLEHVDLPTLRLLESLRERAACQDCVRAAIRQHSAAIPLTGLLSRRWLREVVTPDACPHDLHVSVTPNVSTHVLTSSAEPSVPILTAPTAATLLITRRCNLHCVHCNVSSSRVDAPEIVGPNTWMRVLDELEEMGVWKVVLSGGEPFVYRHFDHLLRHFATKRYAKGILTNGTMVTAAHVRAFKEADIVPVLSLDGADAPTHDRFRGTSGAFVELMKTLSCLAVNDVPFALTTVIHAENQDQLRGIAEIAYRHFAGRLNVTPFKALGRGRTAQKRGLDANSYARVIEDVHQIRAAYRGLRLTVETSAELDHYGAEPRDTQFVETPYGFTSCAAGTDTLVVNDDGRVYPCMLAMQLGVGEVGDVKELQLNNIWQKGKWGIFRQPIRSGCRAVILSRALHHGGVSCEMHNVSHRKEVKQTAQEARLRL